MEQHYFLLVLQLAWLGINARIVSITTAEECRPITLPMCQAMPWNLTRFPNLLHQNLSESDAVSIEQFRPLLETNCSDHLLFFLCAMYTPKCTDQLSQLVPPCRRVCQRVKRLCEPMIKKYDIIWPETLECDRLPVYDKVVCNSPHAIVPATDGGKYQLLFWDSLNVVLTGAISRV